MSQSRQVSIPTRIFIAFAAATVVFTALASGSVWQHRNTALRLRTLHDGYLPLATRLGEAKAQQAIFRQQLERVVSEPTANRSWFRAARQIRPATRRRIEQHMRRAMRIGARYDPGGLDAANASFSQIATLYAESEPGFDALVLALAGSDEEEVLRLRRELDGSEAEIASLYRDAYNHVVDRIEVLSSVASDRERQASIVMAVLALLGLGLGALATWWSRRILRPLPILQERTRAIAGGDLSRGALQLTGNNEITGLARDFERMVDALAARDARLAALRKMQAQIVEDLSVAILVLGDSGEALRTSNPSADLLLEECGGLGSLRESLPELEAQIQAVLESGDALELEAIEIGERSFDARISVFGAAGGDEVLLILDDITDALQTKERLIRTERLAAIGRMAAHVTHEVRNPLSSIGLNLEMLGDELPSEGPAGEESRALLGAIQREVDRLGEITEEYLRLARLPQPRLEPEDLREFCEHLLAFVGPEMSQAGVDVRLEVEGESKPVALDEGQLRQALLNLLRNAREAMNGGGEIDLQIRPTGEYVEVSIRDHGVGIPTDRRGRIFELFFTTKERGSGLGLPLTQQIIVAHGGTIRCEAANPGTRFVIQLPIFRGSEGAEGDLQTSA